MVEESSPSEAVAPLGFLKLLAHEVRWMLVIELARSDLRVGELITRAGLQSSNLVSYHLGLLRGGGLVRERRSSADAREVYYSLDLRGVARMLGYTAARLRTGLLRSPRAALRSVGSAVAVRVCSFSALTTAPGHRWRKRCYAA